MGAIDRNGNDYGVVDVTIDYGSVAANTSEEEAITVNGLTTDMFVAINKSDLDAGLVVGNVRVSAANTLSLTIGNLTAGALDPASETYKLFWFKPNVTSSGVVSL